ncbi:MAG TPA: sigma-70 family RNA polymerase sigma factor [Planctomycetota bacterium]
MTLPRPGPRVELESALAHAPYVRGLARELVLDAELARDVEQETWLAALENEPRDRGALRGWLAALVHNFAVKAWRSGARREARERAVAAREASVPSASEILEREDLRRHLVEAVLALDEPLRVVLVLRFLEELPPREVARRLALPVETVRTRTKRGLELLRGRLDRENRGGRAAWALALVRGLKVSASGAQLATILLSSLATGVWNMKLARRLSVSAAALVLATGAAVLWLVDGETRGSGVTPAAPELGFAAPAAPAAAPAVLAGAATTSAPARVAGSSQPALPGPGGRETMNAVGSVRLRVAWHDGTPAADVAATVYWNAAEDYYADAFDVRTGADGTCRFELPPTLVHVLPDRADDDQILQGEVLAGAETELVLTLARGCDVSGSVTEADGTPVAGAEVLLDRMGGGWGGHVVARSDAAGHFSIRSVGPGLCWVHARAAGHAPAARESRVVGGGTSASVTLTLPGAGGALEGTVRDGSGAGLAGAQVLVGDEHEMALRGPAPQRAIADENGHFRIDGIAEGSVPVCVRAPGHAPHRGEATIVAGQSSPLDVTLAAGATLEGTATDAGGVPLARVEIFTGRGGFGERFAITQADGSFRMHSLPAGELTLVARHEGAGSATATLTGAPGAVLVWNPVLGGAAITGTISMPGVDLTGCAVSAESYDPGGQSVFLGAAVDAAGNFTLPGLADADYRLEVTAGGQSVFPVAVIAAVRPGGAPLQIDVDPALRPSARLIGRVLDAQGSPLADVSVSVWRVGHNRGPLLAPAADGTFACGPFSPGSYGVTLRRDETVLRVGPFEVQADQTWDLGDLQLTE